MFSFLILFFVFAIHTDNATTQKRKRGRPKKTASPQSPPLKKIKPEKDEKHEEKTKAPNNGEVYEVEVLFCFDFLF